MTGNHTYCKIIGLDPGGTTGVCIFLKVASGNGAWPYEAMFRFDQIDRRDHHKALWHLLSTENPTHVIVERFQSRPITGGNGVVNIDAAEYVGVAKLYCKLTEKPCILQQASAAKGFWTDDKIKRLNLWQPGKRHAMDALRHVLYYLTVEGDPVPVRAVREARQEDHSEPDTHLG